MADTLLEVRHLSKHFPVKSSKILSKEKKVVKAIDDVSFDVYQGEALGLVGESGCGKTTTGRCILRLTEPTDGKVTFCGKEVESLDRDQLRGLRRDMQIVFQDPYGCLDPRQKVGNIIARPIKLHEHLSGTKLRERVRYLMEVVGLQPEYSSRYPHEFSGGQRQRIGIARALALHPKFVVCDEPVSALDVSIQAQIINLMQKLQRQFGLTYLFISHDLRVVHHIADRVAVMYLGSIVEIGKKEDIFSYTAHPYTQALLSAIPQVQEKVRESHREKLEGDVPSPVNIPAGCRFHTRCRYAQDICRTQQPALTDLGNGHLCACHFAAKLNKGE